MSRKLKFRLQPVPQQAPNPAADYTAPELEFVHIEQPAQMKDAATQRRIRRHVMRNVDRARGGGRAASSVVVRRSTSDRVKGLVLAPTPAGLDYFGVCSRFECLFRSMDMISEGLLAMTVADLSFHSRLTVGDDLGQLQSLPLYKQERPINGISQYTESVHLVRESMAQLQHEPSRNAVMGTIICLAYLDMRVHNFGRCKMHLDGLSKIVDLCGGLEALESCNAIRQALFIADVLDSTNMDSQPRFQVPREGPAVPSAHVGKPVQNMLHSFARRIEQSPSDQVALGVVEGAFKSASQLASLLNRFGGQEEMTVNLLLSVCRITHGILSLPALQCSSRSTRASSVEPEADASTTSPACAMAELVRLTSLNLARMVMDKTSGDDLYCVNIEGLVLRQLLQRTSDSDWQGFNERGVACGTEWLSPSFQSSASRGRMASSNLKAEYDVVFVGGGTAACVTAGRLAKADPKLAILLIEQGHTNLEVPSIVTPAMFLSHLFPGSETVMFHSAKKESSLADRGLVVPSGGILGGGSSINFTMYTRASAVDFDSWKTEGWDGKHLMALANKAENHQLDDPKINESAHGHAGPIQISYGTHCPKMINDDIFDAAEALGIPHVANLQDFEAGHGFERWAKYISPDGRRQDTAHGYIHPLLKSGNYPNLHILPDSTVTRIKFDGTRAVGVEYEPTSNKAKVAAAFIAAKKQVVVTAGALTTPLILERSGLGRAELLRDLGIDVVSDLPGVGENYQDHNLITYRYKAKLTPETSFDGLLSGREDIAEAMAAGSSKMGWNGLDIGGKLRPTEDEVAQLGPAFRERWERDFEHQPTRPVMLLAFFAGYFGDHVALNEPADNPAHYMTTGAFTAYPYARGSVHLTSADPRGGSPAEFATGFLADPVDLTKQVWAYKKQREIMRRSDRYAGEEPNSHPSFPAGSKAACRDGPAVEGGFRSVAERAALPPIEYSKEDDEAIEGWIRKRIQTAWHSVGTCKMAPREEGGVVDKDLNVHGTQGIKVADLSILPENVGANTYNTALIVGERAAEIIGQELGLTV
ncbi:alcohol dehydrogenase [Cordyceps fumosorosea ARSEF 2679]|uniref:Alcohol dehydrogenase n=1 Tax=Cordyceps fumosorosea (strain ARSEF 2679) TaxID=1081104 RepID=A0A168DAZ7_CORFA|nr:alcohol dehydrogenase [Cordyceps fumosorosea ARSEF 2679]OAA72378.1 alcohol dehydrogenase [Cordyceps fumosorosea ARSEF 2679]